MHKNTSKKGFTLVEIMIVVVIIGLLAAMAIPAFQKVRESSRSSAMDKMMLVNSQLLLSSTCWRTACPPLPPL